MIIRRHRNWAVVGLLMAGTAAAQPSNVYTQPFSFAPTPGVPDFVTFPGFDSMGGTRPLGGVSLEYQFTAAFDLTAENLSTSSGTVTGRWFRTVRLLGPGDLGTLAGSSNDLPATLLQPFDGVLGSGRDFHNYGRRSGTNGGSNSTLDTAMYLDAPSISIAVTLESLGASLSGLAPLDIRATNPTIQGQLILSYYVPAPAGIIPLLAGGAWASRRRRA